MQIKKYQRFRQKILETTEMLIYGKRSLNVTHSTYILKATTDFLLETKIFEQRFF